MATRNATKGSKGSKGKGSKGSKAQQAPAVQAVQAAPVEVAQAAPAVAALPGYTVKGNGTVVQRAMRALLDKGPQSAANVQRLICLSHSLKPSLDQMVGRGHLSYAPTEGGAYVYAPTDAGIQALASGDILPARGSGSAARFEALLQKALAAHGIAIPAAPVPAQAALVQAAPVAVQAPQAAPVASKASGKPTKARKPTKGSKARK